MTDKKPPDSLTILKLPEGGFVISDGPGGYEGGGYRAFIFASTKIDEALAFMRAKIAPALRK